MPKQMFYTCSPLGNLYSSIGIAHFRACGSGARLVKSSRIMLQVGHVGPNVCMCTAIHLTQKLWAHGAVLTGS